MALKLTAKTPGQGFELPEAGSQPAVLVAIVELGTHESEYEGKKSQTRKVYLVWELTDCPMSGTDNNHLLGKEYSFTFGENAALRKMVEKWRGKKFGLNEEFDLEKILGKPCLLAVIHATSKGSGRDYAKIDGVSDLPRSMPQPRPKRKPVLWEIEGQTNLPEHLDWLPFLFGRNPIDVIKDSDEWKALRGTGAGTSQDSFPEDDEEEIPF